MQRPLISAPPPRSNSFARAAFALVQGRVRNVSPATLIPRSDETAAHIIQRADASPLTTTTVGGGAELARVAFREFLIDLEAYSGAARLIAQAVPARVTGASAAHYPVRVGRKVPTFVEEADAIPVVSGDLDDVVIGPAKKMAHIVAWSAELGKRPGAAGIFSTMLREDVAAGLDAAFFADTAATDAAPAGLLYGLSSVTPSGAAGEDGIKADLAQLAAVVGAGGSGQVTFIVAPDRLASARILAPEVIANADIVASGAVASDRVIAVDGPSLLVSTDPEPDMFTAQHAAIHMSDSPLPIVAANGTVADPVRSLWQTGSTALRVIHELAFVARRSGAVAFSDGINW